MYFGLYDTLKPLLLGADAGVGISFLLGWAVTVTYGVASTYVLADTYDKAAKMSRVPGSQAGEVAVAAVDTLLWQAFASVIVPGFLINRICAASLVGLARTIPGVAENARKWMVTGIGLGVIPFIVHPIDSGVHMV